MDAAKKDLSGVSSAPTTAAPAAKPRGQAGNYVSRYAVIGVWALMILLFGIAKPKLFLTFGNFESIVNPQYSLVFMALALLCTIIVGEFVDLSVPAVFGFAGTIQAVLVANHHWGVWPSALVALIGALVIGAVNGLLVVVAGVNTIVVTLGMGTLLTGIADWMSNMNTLTVPSSSFSKIAIGTVGGVDVSFIYGVAIVLAFAYVLGYTPLGRHMRFVGANREVSRLSGVRVDRIRYGSYVAAAAFAGIGAVVTIAGNQGITMDSVNSYQFPIFASVFLGAAVIQPGRFNPIGTWIGIYFLATGVAGFNLLGLATWVEDLFYGGVLIAAVTIATLLRRRIST